jgi:hypothetical protein
MAGQAAVVNGLPELVGKGVAALLCHADDFRRCLTECLARQLQVFEVGNYTIDGELP